MQRRDVLKILAALPFATLTGALYNPTAHGAQTPQQHDRYVDHISAIPILAFYRVDNNPRFPEDISPQQLSALFLHIWSQGFRPVSMSDILLNRVDSIVPAGYKPIGITSDGAHASMIFSSTTAPKGSDKGPLKNSHSFVEIFAASLQNITMPRATFFLSIPKGRQNNSYFGSVMQLKDILDVMHVMPDIEYGYQTKFYNSLGGLSGPRMREVMEFQMEDFQKLGVFERISRIISYPYSSKPQEAGMIALRDLQFLGGTLTYPGVGEAHHKIVPHCLYDGKLMSNAFLIPRVAIGSHAYALGSKPVKNPAIDPIDDFAKDVTRAIPKLYVSKGAS